MNKRESFDLTRYFLRWQDGRLSPSERKQLEKWLNAAPENQKAWTRVQQVWQASSSLAVPKGVAQGNQWQRLLDRLPAMESGPAYLKSRLVAFISQLSSFSWLSSRWAIAGASVLILFVLVKFWPSSIGQDLQTVTVPYGQQYKLVLSDGSSVHLNAGSIFKYPKSFNSKIRKVELRGEGYFEVEHGDRSFVVETPQATTEVVGTEFNLRSWEYETIVFVKRGRVTIRPKLSQGDDQIEIAAGQAATCDVESVRLRPVENPEDVLAWREGRLVFRRKPLNEVLAEMERFFNVQIQADSSLLQHTITGSFTEEPLPKMVQALAAALNVRYTKGARGYRLMPK
ncbi:MAG: FecR domain-containing protein [bacterium]